MGSNHQLNSSKFLIGLLFLGPFLLFFLVHGIWGFNGLYGQDGYEYLRYTEGITTLFQSGEALDNFIWPVGYPLLASLIGFLGIPLALALQLISITAVIACAYLLWFCLKLKEENDRATILFAGLFCAFSPLLLRSGVLVMSDALAACLVSASLFAYLIWTQKQRKSALIGFLFFSSLAVLTRYATGGILFPLVIHALLLSIKWKQYRTLLFSLGFGALTFLPNFLIRGSQGIEVLGRYGSLDWSVLHFFQREFTTNEGTVNYLLPNLLYVGQLLVHPGFLLPAIVILVFIRKEDIWSGEKRWISVGLLVYLLFLAGIPRQNIRFLLLGLPFFLYLIFPAFLRLLHWLNRKLRLSIPIKLAAILGLLGCQLFLWYRSSKPMMDLHQREQLLVSHMKEIPAQPLYTLAVDLALEAEGYEGAIRNIWREEFQEFEKGSYVIFDPIKWPKQWEGKNPGINWERMNEQHDLDSLKAFEGGWVLYQLK